MRRVVWGVVIVGLALGGSSLAWWVKGHESIAEAAANQLPMEMPQFFRAGGKALAHFAGDPDRWKNRDAKFLRAAEACDHYLDLEDLEGKEWPEDRWKAVALINKLGKKTPDRVGLLPYATMEDYDRLCCAFFDYREDPKNEAIKWKCLVYAGVLSHFSGDTAMPLHTTVDYDGRKGGIQKGIHAKIDAFPERFGLTPEEICRDLKPQKIDNMWEYVGKTFKESYTHIDRCYELDKKGAFEKPTPESRQFILDRCRVAAQFTMNLWYNAWLKSADMPPHY